MDKYDSYSNWFSQLFSIGVPNYRIISQKQ